MANVRVRADAMRRRLTTEQRAELLRLIANVPADADAQHPSVLALVEFERDLRLAGIVPWWAPSGAAYLRVAGRCVDGRTTIEVGLHEMRRLAMTEDWGEDRRP